MQSLPVAGLTVYYEPQDRAAAEVITAACEVALRLLREAWGLIPPADCRVYVMTSVESYLRHAPPPAWRAGIALIGPLLLPRFRRVWPVAGGWAQRFGRRYTIGVKPPRLMLAADQRPGMEIFIPEESPEEKTRQVTCHELTHACSTDLRLPVWLHEGLAMLTVDKLAGHPTVLPASLARLSAPPTVTLRDYGRLRNQAELDALVRLYIRAYWLARYLDVQRPDVLRALLRKQPHPAAEAQLAQALGMRRDALWPNVDALLVAHFKAS